jgi:hypothetical protein
LPGDDIGVFERRDQRCSCFFHEFRGCLLTGRKCRLTQRHDPTIPLDCGFLHSWRCLRHDDISRNTANAGRKRERLGVISTGVGHNAAGCNGGVEFADGVRCPAKLERTGLLEVLALDEDLAAGQTVERLRGHDGGSVDGPGNPGCCLLNRCEVAGVSCGYHAVGLVGRLGLTARQGQE